VTYVCDIPHITHFVTQVQEVTIDGIEAAKGAAIAQVNVIIHGGAADIHPDVTRGDGAEQFFFTRKGVVNLEWARFIHRAQR
jgi:hypothetical protein